VRVGRDEKRHIELSSASLARRGFSGNKRSGTLYRMGRCGDLLLGIISAVRSAVG
jgi:hypothetical protein